MRIVKTGTKLGFLSFSKAIQCNELDIKFSRTWTTIPLTARIFTSLSGNTVKGLTLWRSNLAAWPSKISLTTFTTENFSARCRPLTLSGSRTRRRLLILFIEARRAFKRSFTSSETSSVASISLRLSSAFSDTRANSCATISTNKPIPAISIILRESCSTSSIFARARCAISVTASTVNWRSLIISCSSGEAVLLRDFRAFLARFASSPICSLFSLTSIRGFSGPARAGFAFGLY